MATELVSACSEPDHPFTVVIHPSGEIDLATAEVFEEELDGAIAIGSPRLIVDMTDVTFIDSSGLARLIAARNSVMPSGVVILRSVPPNVRGVLEMCGLCAIFPIEDAPENDQLS